MKNKYKIGIVGFGLIFLLSLFTFEYMYIQSRTTYDVSEGKQLWNISVGISNYTPKDYITISENVTPNWYLKINENNRNITINGNECKPVKCGIDYCFYCGVPDRIIIKGNVNLGINKNTNNNFTNLEIPSEHLKIIVPESMYVGIENYVPSCARAEWWETGVPVEYQEMYHECINKNRKCMNIANSTLVDCPKGFLLS